MRKEMLLGLIIISSNLSFSQNNDSLYKKYNNDLIFRLGRSMRKGNDKISFRELSREFSMSDLGLDLYFKSKRCRTTSTILSYASMLSGFIYMGIAVNNGNKNTAYLFLGSQVAFLFTSRNYAIMASENLDRALWQRNKDLLFPVSH